jgi:hypothetical protein
MSNVISLAAGPAIRLFMGARLVWMAGALSSWSDGTQSTLVAEGTQMPLRFSVGVWDSGSLQAQAPGASVSIATPRGGVIFPRARATAFHFRLQMAALWQQRWQRESEWRLEAWNSEMESRECKLLQRTPSTSDCCSLASGPSSRLSNVLYKIRPIVAKTQCNLSSPWPFPPSARQNPPRASLLETPARVLPSDFR